MSARKVQRRVNQYNNVPDKDVDPYAVEFEYKPHPMWGVARWAGALALLIVIGLSIVGLAVLR